MRRMATTPSRRYNCSARDPACAPILAWQRQQLLRGTRRFCRPVLVGDTVVTALLRDVFAKQLAGSRIHHTHHSAVPLHLHGAADPTRRRTVEGGVDLHTAIQIYAPITELIMPEQLEGQWQQGWLLLLEHGGHLAFGGSVNARVGPVLLPAAQIGLSVCQALET